MLIRVMLESNKSASELCKIIKMYPQVLVNAKIDSKRKKTMKQMMRFKQKLEN